MYNEENQKSDCPRIDELGECGIRSVMTVIWRKCEKSENWRRLLDLMTGKDCNVIKKTVNIWLMFKFEIVIFGEYEL